MTVEEALKIVTKNDIVENDYVSCLEFKEYYVFFTNPNSFGNGKAINKNTKEIVGYKPWLIPIDEFKKGGKKYNISKKV